MAETINLMSYPVQIDLVTEDVPLRQEPSDFNGELVNVYRIRQINVANSSGYAWNLVVYRDGEPLYVQEITAGMVRSFTIQSNRRFELTRYSVGASVVR